MWIIIDNGVSSYVLSQDKNSDLDAICIRINLYKEKNIFHHGEVFPLLPFEGW